MSAIANRFEMLFVSIKTIDATVNKGTYHKTKCLGFRKDKAIRQRDLPFSRIDFTPECTQSNQNNKGLKSILEAVKSLYLKKKLYCLFTKSNLDARKP